MVGLRKKIGIFAGMLACLAVITACGGLGSDVTGTAIGWHFQGIDCLSCHNVDLISQKHQLVAGTLFKNTVISDTYDLSNVCNVPLRVQFLDFNFRVKLDSRDYEDSASRGYRGMGNLFILMRMLDTLQGSYFIRILSEDGVKLAQSVTPHSFTSSFDKSNPADLMNRYSCNACHSRNPVAGATGGIYAQTNVNKCQ